jgi:ATP-dependent protease ClpP protease subunit
MTNKLNPLHFFNAATADDVLTLNIMDVIGSDLFGNGITARMVTDAINQAGHFESITLSINSPGGELFEGVAIYNTLRAVGKPVNVEIIGLAASAASLIAMAGNTITAMPGSVMMIHEAMALCMGYAADMLKEAAVLETVTSSAADLYVAKTKLSKTKVLALMAAETWMEPKEAVELGFADEVSSTKKARAAATNSFDLSRFKNVPKELVEPELPADVEVIPCDHSTPCGYEHYKMKDEPDPLIDIFRHRLEMLRA